MNKKTNYKFKPIGDWEFTKKRATKKEVDSARKKANELIKEDIGNLGMRSCWQCNLAHTHFLRGKWGHWVLFCIQCGKYYYNKIDITIYD